MDYRLSYVPTTDVCLSVQALLAAGEPAKASLCLRVLLENSLEAHKQDVLVLLFLVKAGFQIGTISSLQGALVHARSAPVLRARHNLLLFVPGCFHYNVPPQLILLLLAVLPFPFVLSLYLHAF